MLYFKQFVLFLFLSFGVVASAQNKNEKESIDPRIIENLGEQETSHIYLNRKDYYEFLVYELNHTCEIMNAGDLPMGQNVKHDLTFLGSISPESFADQVKKQTLNIKKFNLPQLHEQPVYIRLYNDVIVKINATMTIKKDFLATGKQNSK